MQSFGVQLLVYLIELLLHFPILSFSRERIAKRKAGETLEAGVRTAVDDEDSWEKELSGFKPWPRKTTADDQCDVHSIRRALDRPLHLVVERKFGNVLHWDLPTAIHQSGETMRDTAERAVKSYCGNHLQVTVLGNAPWSFYKYRYPRKIRDKTGKQGEKVFIFKAFLNGGSVSINHEICNDFKWALREELWDALDHTTRRALFEVLYDEE